MSKYRGLRGNSYVENADAYVNKHSIVLDEGTLPCITGQRLPHCFESRRETFEADKGVSNYLDIILFGSRIDATRCYLDGNEC